MAILNPDSPPCVKGGDRHMTSREDRQGVKRRVCVWCGRLEIKTNGIWQIVRSGDKVPHEGLSATRQD